MDTFQLNILSASSACHFSCAFVTAVLTAFWTRLSNSA